MELLDLTLLTPEENLALDEALLEEAEAAPKPIETLRLWESPAPFVVLGRSSQIAREVHLQNCRARGVPVLRRASGGGTILTGPGCLMYAVVLSYETRPNLRALEAAHRFVLETTLSGLKKLVPQVTRQGTSDLTLGEFKFSGNSLRCKRRVFLYHGTLLYHFPLSLVEECLAMPPREPDYRQGRSHQVFLANLPVASAALRAALQAAWQPLNRRPDWPEQRVQELVAQKYSQSDWNHKL